MCFKTVSVNVSSLHGPQHPSSQGAWLHGLVRLSVAHKQPRRRAALRRGVVGALLLGAEQVLGQAETQGEGRVMVTRGAANLSTNLACKKKLLVSIYSRLQRLS